MGYRMTDNTRTSPWGLISACAGASLAVVACTGTIGDAPTASKSSALSCTEVHGTPAPLRRLTKTQYENTVSALFGPGVTLRDVVSARPSAGHFSNEIAQLGVDATAAERMFLAAEEVAPQVISGVLSVCDPAAEGESTCVERFFDEHGLRIQRRPLEADERALMKGLFDAERADGSTYAEAMESLLTAMLTSPQFWYIDEAGTGPAEGGYTALDDYELASRLSYYLWDSMPDDVLLARAAAGELQNHDNLLAEAERMLALPAARSTIRRFYREWLMVAELDGVTKDPAFYPSFDNAMLDIMRDQVDRYVDDVYGGSRTFEALLLSTTMPQHAALSPILGDAPSYGSDGWGTLTVDAAERRGILTLPALMTALSAPNRTSIVRRGVFFHEHVLCGPVAPPPDNIAPLEQEVVGATQREKLAAHRADPACAGCHDLFDPPGFGFEHYDALGGFRAVDETGAAVDSRLTLDAPSELAGDYEDVLGLLDKLPSSETAQACFAKHWLRFAKGRFEAKHDRCDLEDTQRRFVEGELDLHQLIVAVVQSNGFRYRESPVGREETP